MVRQEFDTEGYWKVIVYYDLDYDFLKPVYDELREIHFSKNAIHKVFSELKKDALAVTCSNVVLHTSIVIFNKHKSKGEYINSIVHEAEHVKQSMLKAYYVEDKGEPPAYTIGYLVKMMWEVFRGFI